MIPPSPQLQPTDPAAERRAPTAVVIDEPERMNLLGLMMASFLTRRLVGPTARRHARGIEGDVELAAGPMRVTLRFRSGRIEVTRSRASTVVASIEGALGALLAGVRGDGMIRSFLGRRIRVHGRPLALWHLLSLVRS